MNPRRLAATAAFALLSAAAAHAQNTQPPAAQPPADAKQEPAKPEPGPGQEPDPQILKGIMDCLAEGLPQDWAKAWFHIQETDRNAEGNARQFEANFFYATKPNDAKGQRLKPCGAEKVLEGVGDLNAYLPESQRRWTGATFTFHRDGNFQASYDFTPVKPAAEKPKAAAKPAAKPAAKKKAEATKK